MHSGGMSPRSLPKSPTSQNFKQISNDALANGRLPKRYDTEQGAFTGLSNFKRMVVSIGTGLRKTRFFVESVTAYPYVAINTASPHTLRCARAGFRLGLCV